MPSYNGFKRWFLGGGEVEGALSSFDCVPKIAPHHPGLRPGRTVSCGLTTYHEDGPPMPMEPTCQPFRIGAPMSSSPSLYHLFVGVDIAASSFMAAWMAPGQAPSTPHPFEQTPTGFALFHKQLAVTGVAPSETLVVLEATGS